MPLTDITIRNAKPADKPQKIADGGGLYLEVSPSGGKLWRMAYRYGRKQKLLSFGKYPIISLADARTCRDEAFYQEWQERTRVEPIPGLTQTFRVIRE